MIQVGQLYKHFKGTNLIEKNIYEIIAVYPKYTGNNNIDLSNIIIYKALFQDNKYFAREESDLVSELSIEQKEKYHQEHRIDLLTPEEIKIINTDTYIKQKEAYIASKY